MQPFRKFYSRPVPADAKIISRKGKRFARLKIDGKFIDAPIVQNPTDPDAPPRCRVQSTKWYGRLKTIDGQRDVPLCNDKDAAQAMLNERQRKEDRRAAGLTDPFDDHSQRPLAEHLAEFQRHLESRGNTGKHVQTTMSRLQAAFDGSGFRRLADLDSDRVADWLRGERDAGRLAIQTSNYYVAACRQFGAWLVRSRRLPANPFAHLDKLNAETDVRRERRALTPDELARMIDAAERSDRTFRGLSGTDRAMLYRAATFTGLRAGELASLTEGSFDFAAGTVTVQAGYSKRRRKDVLPLHPDLAFRVQAWLQERREQQDGPAIIPIGGKPADVALWPGTWKDRAAEMIYRDMKAGRDAWLKETPEGSDARKERERSAFLCPVDGDGMVFDFHGTRHQFISTLTASGVHPKTAQELARHSTINLTMNRYTHVGLVDLTAALDKLPTLPTIAKQAAQATGTDDADAEFLSPMLSLTHGNSCPKVSIHDHSGGSDAEPGKCENPRKQAVFSGDFECREGEAQLPALRNCNPPPAR